MTSTKRVPAMLLALALGACTAASAQDPPVPPPTALERCDAPRDCVVLPRTCCGACGVATHGDVIAVAASQAEAYSARRCRGQGCPQCARAPDPTLLATCRDHRCAVVDLTRSPLTRCSADDECAVRHAGCCACGSRGWIAVRRGSEDALVRATCGRVQCPECVGPRVPEGTTAICDEGHCAVSDGRPRGPERDLDHD